MKRRIMKRKHKRLLIILLFIALIIIGTIICLRKNSSNKTSYEAGLEKELKSVNNLAMKAWGMAYSNGKKEDNEILEYIIQYLKSEQINIDNYYLTLTSKGVNVTKKHIGLLVEPGYYEADTNFENKVKDWNSLINSRDVNLVEGRLGFLRKQYKKIDVALSSDVTIIKDKVVEEGLEIGAIAIPNSVTYLSNIAFKDAHVEEIVLEAKLKELDGHFKDMTTLKRITFTNDIKLIKGKTFINTNIEEVNFIGTIEEFVGIKYATYFDVPTQDKKCKLYINGILLDEVYIKNGVTEIKDFALHNYTNITKINLPSTIKRIGTSAFTGTNVKEIIYNGTKEMWNEIVKMEEWYFGEISCTVFCTDGEIVY